jgi:UbiD family decarboxylase
LREIEAILFGSCGRNSFPNLFAISITHRQDAVYPATIVGIPPKEDFYIGGASVKLFLPIFKMNFPEIMDMARRILARLAGLETNPRPADVKKLKGRDAWRIRVAITG